LLSLHFLLPQRVPGHTAIFKSICRISRNSGSLYLLRLRLNSRQTTACARPERSDQTTLL
jgi:hypothetical protein